MQAFILTGLFLLQTRDPAEPTIPPRWEREAPRDEQGSRGKPYEPPAELSSAFPGDRVLGGTCTLRPVDNPDARRTNPAYYRALDPLCLSMRTTFGIPVSDCGLAFYHSPSGDLSAVLAYALPTEDSAEAARKKLADRYPSRTVSRVRTVVLFVLDEGTPCGVALSSAIKTATPP
jgi:hypothetical protein